MHKVFFMVVNLNKSQPVKVHATYEDACNEADRLARQHPGEEFYTLKAIDRFWVDVSSVSVVRLSHPAEGSE